MERFDVARSQFTDKLYELETGLQNLQNAVQAAEQVTF